MSQETIQNVVEQYRYFDSAGDIDMLRVIYFDEAKSEFKFRDFYGCMLGGTILTNASIELQDKYKLQKIQEKQFNSILSSWSDLIENGVCPSCRNYTKIITNEKFLWVLSKKGLCSAPYKHNTIAKGSCKECQYVTWCMTCNINFSIRNYHRSFMIYIIRNAAKIGEIRIHSGMGETSYTLEVVGRDTPGITDKTTLNEVLGITEGVKI